MLKHNNVQFAILLIYYPIMGYGISGTVLILTQLKIKKRHARNYVRFEVLENSTTRINQA